MEPITKPNQSNQNRESVSLNQEVKEGQDVSSFYKNKFALLGTIVFLFVLIAVYFFVPSDSIKQFLKISQPAMKKIDTLEYREASVKFIEIQYQANRNFTLDNKNSLLQALDQKIALLNGSDNESDRTEKLYLVLERNRYISAPMNTAIDTNRESQMIQATQAYHQLLKEYKNIENSYHRERIRDLSISGVVNMFVEACFQRKVPIFSLMWLTDDKPKVNATQMDAMKETINFAYQEGNSNFLNNNLIFLSNRAYLTATFLDSFHDKVEENTKKQFISYLESDITKLSSRVNLISEERLKSDSLNIAGELLLPSMKYAFSYDVYLRLTKNSLTSEDKKIIDENYEETRKLFSKYQSYNPTSANVIAGVSDFLYLSSLVARNDVDNSKIAFLTKEIEKRLSFPTARVSIEDFIMTGYGPDMSWTSFRQRVYALIEINKDVEKLFLSIK